MQALTALQQPFRRIKQLWQSDETQIAVQVGEKDQQS